MTKSIPKRPEPKLCPTCWNDMRHTADGYVCPRHGLVIDTRAEAAPARAKAPSGQVARPTRKRPTKPRQPPQQTKRMTAMLDTIIARNRDGESLAAIATDVWSELGYADAHVCASKISRFLRKRGVEIAGVRSGPTPGSRAMSRYSDERLSAVRAAVDDGETIWAFAGSHWRAWGFTSQSACDSLIRKWLRTKVPA